MVELKVDMLRTKMRRLLLNTVNRILLEMVDMIIYRIE
jgi:hypothetical protein